MRDQFVKGDGPLPDDHPAQILVTASEELLAATVNKPTETLTAPCAGDRTSLRRGLHGYMTADRAGAVSASGPSPYETRHRTSTVSGSKPGPRFTRGRMRKRTARTTRTARRFCRVIASQTVPTRSPRSSATGSKLAAVRTCLSSASAFASSGRNCAVIRVNCMASIKPARERIGCIVKPATDRRGVLGKRGQVDKVAGEQFHCVWSRQSLDHYGSNQAINPVFSASPDTGPVRRRRPQTLCFVPQRELPFRATRR